MTTVPAPEILWLDWWDGHTPMVMWDQAQLRELLAEHVPVHHVTTNRTPPGNVHEATVVVPGRFAHDDVDAVNDFIAHLDRVLVVVTSDEESLFPYEQLVHPNMRLWVQTPQPDRGPADLHLGCGPPPDTHQILRDLEAGDRPYAWVYDGQINHPRRVAMKAATAALPPPLDRASNLWTATHGFTQGHPRTDYLHRLHLAKVALCPAGPWTPDTFRLWEALEAGTLPLAGAIAPNANQDGLYWQHLLGTDPPWPLIHDWESLQGHLVDALADWPHNLNRTVAWWLRYKQHLRRVTADTFTWLDGNDRTGTVTVLVVTSPTMTNPDTTVIEATMASVRDRLPTADVVLMVDGTRPDTTPDRVAAYGEYVRRVLWLANHRWRNVTPIVADEWLHQVHLTRLALEHVTTPVVLFVEHDTPLEQDIPFDELAQPILSGDVHVIRLLHESEILPVHQRLMLDPAPRDFEGVPLRRTWQWSQRPHLASSNYYRDIIDRIAGPDARCFIEDVMVGICERAYTGDQRYGWFQNRVTIYEPEGNIRRSHHLDARGTEPKGGQRFDYPTINPPAGAPHPRWIPG